MKTLHSLICVSILAVSAFNARGIVSTSPGGDWNSPSTWVGGLVPGPSDPVIIAGGTSVTVSSAVECLSLVVENTVSSGSTLTIAAGSSLVVGASNGVVTIGSNLTSVSTETETTIIVDGSLYCGNIYMTARRFTGKEADVILRVNSNTAVVETSGDVIQDKNAPQGTLRNQVRFNAAGVFRLKGTFVAVNFGGVTTFSGSGTVDYCNEGPQVVAGFDYNNLTISGSGEKTASGQVTIKPGGTMRLKDTATFAGLTPVFESNTTLFYAGSSPQTTGPELPLVGPNNWTFSISNSFGLTLTQPVTVSGLINLFEGKVFTGLNVLAQEGTLIRTNGYVVGNLRKNLPVGSAVSRLFEVGSSAAYGPVSLTFSNITAGGRLTVGSADGDHPEIGSSTLNGNKSVNVHWEMATDGTLSFGSYNVVFNYDAADLDAGVDPLLLVAGHKSVVWSLPSVSARTTNSLSLDGLTSFSGFQLAENDNRLVPVLGWDAPVAITYGTALSTNQLNATSSLPGTFSYSAPLGTVLDAGENQTITATFIPDDPINVASGSTNVSITVQPALLTVTVDNKQKLYGTTNPVFTGSVVGLQNGDIITADFTCSADETSDIGVYPILLTLTDLANRLPNYTVSTNAGNLSIVQPAALLAVSRDGGNTLVQILEPTNFVYTIEATSDLSSTNWQVLGPTASGVSGLQELVDADSATVRFYRARQ